MEFALGGKVLLLEKEQSLLYIEVGSIQVSTVSWAFVGCFGDLAYTAEKPFSAAFEKGMFYGGGLESAHINDEGKVVYTLVRPAVGSSKDIVKVVVVGDAARDVVFVGMLEDIDPLFELGFEVVDIPEINIVTVLISIEGVEVYALYFPPLA